jgi:hypothetical protein
LAGSVPSSLPSSTSTPTPSADVTSDLSGDETVSGPPARPIGRKQAKVAYQEQQLQASNHENLKKMATAHTDIAAAVKNQQLMLSTQQDALQRIADEAIMNKDLTGADEDVKKYYMIQRKKILTRLEESN